MATNSKTVNNIPDKNSKDCILCYFVNENRSGVAYCSWLENKYSESDLQDLIRTEEMVTMSWPNCGDKKITNETSWQRVAVKILAFGAWPDMTRQSKNFEKYGLLDPSKKERKLVKRKPSPSDDENEEETGATAAKLLLQEKKKKEKEENAILKVAQERREDEILNQIEGRLKNLPDEKDSNDVRRAESQNRSQKEVPNSEECTKQKENCSSVSNGLSSLSTAVREMRTDLFKKIEDMSSEIENLKTMIKTLIKSLPNKKGSCSKQIRSKNPPILRSPQIHLNHENVNQELKTLNRSAISNQNMQSSRVDMIRPRAEANNSFQSSSEFRLNLSKTLTEANASFASGSDMRLNWSGSTTEMNFPSRSGSNSSLKSQNTTEIRTLSPFELQVKRNLVEGKGRSSAQNKFDMSASTSKITLLDLKFSRVLPKRKDLITITEDVAIPYEVVTRLKRRTPSAMTNDLLTYFFQNEELQNCSLTGKKCNANRLQRSTQRIDPDIEAAIYVYVNFFFPNEPKLSETIKKTIKYKINNVKRKKEPSSDKTPNMTSQSEDVESILSTSWRSNNTDYRAGRCSTPITRPLENRNVYNPMMSDNADLTEYFGGRQPETNIRLLQTARQPITRPLGNGNFYNPMMSDNAYLIESFGRHQPDANIRLPLTAHQPVPDNSVFDFDAQDNTRTRKYYNL